MCRLVLAIFDIHAEYEVSTITCNEDMKGNAKCINSRLETHFGRLRGNTQRSSMAQWKAHCQLLISDK